jgi:hypothetical protein
MEVGMARTSGIKEHMEVIGADGVHVGTVDKVEGDRIKLTKSDSGQGSHQGHHHYVPAGLVAEVEGDKVRLSATGANALLFQQEEDEDSARLVTQGRDRDTPPSRSKGNSSPASWLLPALGTAAVAAAGAAFYSTRRKSDTHKADTRKFELQLQTDENVRLISSTKVEGTPVVGRDGEHLGKIESFMVDKYTGRVAYAIMSFGGTLGYGEHLFPLPWSLLDYDVQKDGYALNFTKEQLERAPKFKPSDAPEFSADYRRSVARAYA